MMPRHARWVKLSLVFFCAVLLVSALAFKLRGGITVTVDEDIDEDLYVWGAAVSIDSTVNGDVYAAGGSVTVKGIINGSVNVVGGTVNIRGQVTHSVRAVGGLVRIDAMVSGDVIALSRDLKVADTAQIGGELYMVTTDAEIGGTIKEKLRGVASDLILFGKVEGDVDVNVETLILQPTAQIGGDLTYHSKGEADIQSGSLVQGTIARERPAWVERQITGLVSATSTLRDKIMAFLMPFILGLVVLLIAFVRTTSMAEAVRRRPWPSLGWGALILVATPIAAMMVAITIVGIPLALMTMILYFMALYLSQVFVGLAIGQLIIGRFRRLEGRAIMIGALALGLALLIAIRSIPLPYFSLAILGITGLFGLGAIIVSERKLRAGRREVASPE
ncbi:MAG: polymer-forming cytoskeletal protein [Dehalococcoidia bacterium]